MKRRKATFYQRIKSWSWQELLWGLENKFIDRKELVNYIVDSFSEKLTEIPPVLRIITAYDYEDIYPEVSELCSSEVYESEIEIKAKWKYVLLQELYDNRDSYENVFVKVDEIYANFGYPEDKVEFIGYMPSNSGKGIEQSWQEFLNKEQRKYV